MAPTSTVIALIGFLFSFSIAVHAAEAPPPWAVSVTSQSASAVEPSCLALADVMDFPELRPLKGLVPMTRAELTHPMWTMFHTRRVPTDVEKQALRAYGLTVAGCLKTQIEFCESTSKGVHKVICAMPVYVEAHASDILKVLVSGGGTFDDYAGAVVLIAAARDAADLRALSLEQTLQAKQNSP